MSNAIRPGRYRFRFCIEWGFACDQIITFLSLYRVLTQSLTRGLLLGFLTAVGFGCEAVGPLAQAELNRLTKALANAQSSA